MKIIALLLFPLLGAVAGAQPFSVEATSIGVVGSTNTAQINVRIDAASGFSASVFLSAAVPGQPGAEIAITPEIINAPYLDNAALTVRLPQPNVGGLHTVVITGRNGPAIASDTVEVMFPERVSWRMLTTEQLEAADMPTSGGITYYVDRSAATAYIVTTTAIGLYDGDSVRKLADFEPWAVKPDDVHQYGYCMDSAGGIWSLWHGSIRRYDIATDTWMIVDRADPSRGISDTILMATHETHGAPSPRMRTASDGTVWILGSRGMFSYDPVDSSWRHYLNTTTDLGRIFTETLPSFTTDLAGNLWFARGRSLAKFDGTYLTVLSMEDLFHHPAVSGGTVFDCDPDWGVLVKSGGNGNIQGGVWAYDGERVERFVPYDEPIMAEYYPVDSFHFDSPIGFLPNDIERPDGASGDVWLALGEAHVGEFRARYTVSTEGGLMRYTNGQWYHYTVENSGLPSNTVYSVTVDSRGRAWIGTSKGTVLLDGMIPPDEAFTNISATSPSRARPAVSAPLTVIPNPVVDRLVVECALPAGNYRLSILSIRGERLLDMEDVTIEAEGGRVEVSTATLATGVYLLEMIDNEGRRSGKMFVKR